MTAGLTVRLFSVPASSCLPPPTGTAKTPVPTWRPTSSTTPGAAKSRGKRTSGSAPWSRPGAAPGFFPCFRRATTEDTDPGASPTRPTTRKAWPWRLQTAATSWHHSPAAAPAIWKELSRRSPLPAWASVHRIITAVMPPLKAPPWRPPMSPGRRRCCSRPMQTWTLMNCNRC